MVNKFEILLFGIATFAFFLALFIVCTSEKTTAIEDSLNETSIIYTNETIILYEGKGELEILLRKEIVNNDDWICYDYANYYNKTLSNKYPELDIRWERKVDICGMGFPNKPLKTKAICSDYHTYLIVNGYCGVCLLDQRTLLCEKLRCEK